MADARAPAGAQSPHSPHTSAQGARGDISPESGAGGLYKAVQSFYSGFASTARLMVGVPDYDAYVRHRQEMHPGEPVMSYEEFFRERQNSRYATAGGKISRCC